MYLRRSSLLWEVEFCFSIASATYAITMSMSIMNGMLIVFDY